MTDAVLSFWCFLDKLKCGFYALCEVFANLSFKGIHYGDYAMTLTYNDIFFPNLNAHVCLIIFMFVRVFILCFSVLVCIHFFLEDTIENLD